MTNEQLVAQLTTAIKNLDLTNATIQDLIVAAGLLVALKAAQAVGNSVNFGDA